MSPDLGKMALAMALLLVPLAARADPVITVTGEGHATAIPDQAEVSAGVASEAKTAAAAIAANRAAMTRVLAALKAGGVAERSIATSNFSLQPDYSADGAPRAITGYSARNEVRVTLEDATRVGAVLDALVAAGANEAGGVNFSVRDEAPLLAEARADAVKDAIQRAETYAHAAGAVLGPIQSITDTGGNASGPVPMFARASAATPISPGEETVSASVTITWTLK